MEREGGEGRGEGRCCSEGARGRKGRRGDEEGGKGGAVGNDERNNDDDEANTRLRGETKKRRSGGCEKGRSRGRKRMLKGKKQTGATCTQEGEKRAVPFSPRSHRAMQICNQCSPEQALTDAPSCAFSCREALLSRREAGATGALSYLAVHPFWAEQQRTTACSRCLHEWRALEWTVSRVERAPERSGKETKGNVTASDRFDAPLNEESSNSLERSPSLHITWITRTVHQAA